MQLGSSKVLAHNKDHSYHLDSVVSSVTSCHDTDSSAVSCAMLSHTHPSHLKKMYTLVIILNA